MKKYQIIGFILWSLGNIILIPRMWDYLFIAPVLAAQVIIWICCSVLFCIDISSRGLFVAINTTLVITWLLGIPCYVVDGNCKTNRAAKHSWNRVCFDGSWWDVDLTNDANYPDNLYGFKSLENLYDMDEWYFIVRTY